MINFFLKKSSKKTIASSHHITSGGFVFFLDRSYNDIYVLLIKNKYDQWWIPKGHIEQGEDDLVCALREIEEETGVSRRKLKHISFCSLDSFSFEKDGLIATKDLYIHIFSVDKKIEPIMPTDSNLKDVKWFKYEEACKILNFNLKELQESKDIFMENKDIVNNNQNKFPVYGPMTWSDYFDKIHLFKDYFESNKNYNKSKVNIFEYFNNKFYIKIFFNSLYGDYFEFGFLSVESISLLEEEFYLLIEKFDLLIWHDSVFQNLKHEIIGKKNNSFIDILSSKNIRSKSLRYLLKNKSNDYSLLETSFKNKFGLDLLSKDPISKNFIIKNHISIIVPSYNSTDTIFSTLETINEQDLSMEDFKKIEVIVIDDGSSDDTSFKIRSKKYKFKLVFFRQNNLGRSSARNIGVLLSSGEIIIFIDSDVFLEKHFVKEHAIRSSFFSSSVFISFRENLKLPVSEIVKRLQNDISPDIAKDFRFEKEVSKDWKRIHIKENDINNRVVKILEETNNLKTFGYGKLLEIWDLPSVALTCSISMRKTEFLKTGGFSLKFRGWGMEDTFLGACLIANGNFIIPIFSTGIYHVKHTERSGGPDTQIKEFNKNVKIYNDLVDKKIVEIIKYIN